MANKRKYPKVQGYWVYSIYIPSINKYYIGYSGVKNCCQRWHKSRYKRLALEQYLDEWDSMVKTVLIDGLSKQESFIYEGKIIDALSMNNLCINSNRSGLITNDKNAYQRELYENNTELRERKKQRGKQWEKDNKEKRIEYDKKYRDNNREKINRKQREYRKNNNEKMREYDKQRRLKKKLEREQQQTVVP